jgi:hypothetical protein
MLPSGLLPQAYHLQQLLQSRRYYATIIFVWTLSTELGKVVGLVDYIKAAIHHVPSVAKKEETNELKILLKSIAMFACTSGVRRACPQKECRASGLAQRASRLMLFDAVALA